METIFWLAVLFYVARRWLKKHPEKAAEWKALLQGSRTEKRAALPGMQAARPATGQPRPQPQAAAKQHPILTVRKKAEKQFQEL